MNLIVTGSIAFDYLMSFAGDFREHILPEKLDAISVSFLVDNLHKREGGCAANISYSLALLGHTPRLVGAAGCDFETYRSRLNEAGVDTTAVLLDDKAYTASFFANTDRRGNQIASFYAGAMLRAREISLQAFSGPESVVIISPNDPEAMSRHAGECREFGIDFIYDPGQQIAVLDGETLLADSRGSAILILNEYELEMFKKKTGSREEELFDLTDTLIVTMGEDGAVIRRRDESYAIPTAKPGSVLDPTGVGDAFRAGLLAGLSWGLAWPVCGRLGSLAAAYVIETDGPQNHRYSLADFIQRYQQNFGPEEALSKGIHST